MPATTKDYGAAVQYAQAVLDLANERQEAESVGQELTQIRQLIEENPTFGLFLRDPGISDNERRQVLERTFQGRVSQLVYNTLGVLSAKNRLGLLPAIEDAYKHMLDEQLGNIHVEVTVVRPLEAADLEHVRQQISTAFGKNAVVEQKVDESIIGGLVLRIGDRLIDASVQSQLQAMRQKLMAAAPMGK